MTTFVTNETEEDDVLFAAWGELPDGKNPKKCLLIKEKENLVGVVTDISDNTTYKKVYRMKVKGQDKPVIVTGKTDLNNKMGYGTKKAQHQVKVNDLIQITFDGKVKTKQGRKMLSFTVGIAKN